MTTNNKSPQIQNDLNEEKRFTEPPAKKRKLNTDDPQTNLTKTADNANQSKSRDVFDISFFGASDKGKKSHMEDRCIKIKDFSSMINSPWTAVHQCRLFGMIDGHGGHNVCDYLESKLAPIIAENIRKYVIPNEASNTKQKDENIHKALHASFKITDLRLLDWMSNSHSQSESVSEGATCTVCYFDNNTVYTACVGDSKAVLARRPLSNDATQDVEVKPLLLTVDHTAMQLSESQRIESGGASIINGRVNGILEVTRSFGDKELKKCGVICAPNVSKFVICERDEFLLIACDGLWSVFSVSDAVKFVNDKFQHLSQPSCKEVVRSLLAEAILTKQAKDNVSAVIVRFK